MGESFDWDNIQKYGKQGVQLNYLRDEGKRI